MDFRLQLYKNRFLAFALFLFGFTILFSVMLMIWAATSPSVIVPPATTGDSTYYPGEAGRIEDILFEGRFIPGWSPQQTPVPTQPRSQPSNFVINQAKIYLINALESPGTQIALDSLTVESVKPTVWLDNQLGCAYPGEMTLPDNVPGWIIAIRYPSNNRLYIFHTNQAGSRLRMCRTMISFQT